jgi:hypothetical protein
LKIGVVATYANTSLTIIDSENVVTRFVVFSVLVKRDIFIPVTVFLASMTTMATSAATAVAVAVRILALFTAVTFTSFDEDFFVFVHGAELDFAFAHHFGGVDEVIRAL